MYNGFENKVTIYYSKRTGEIQTFCTGIQDMNFFGSNKEDYSIIWDFIVCDYIDTIIQNLNLFYVDIETKDIKQKLLNLRVGI